MTAAVERRRIGTGPVAGTVWTVLFGAAGLVAGVWVRGLIAHGDPASAALANAGAPYAVALALPALIRRRPVRAALDALAFFASFVVGYYIAVLLTNGRGAIEHRYATIWLLIALVFCPIGAAVLTWARRRGGVVRGVVFALPASAAVAECLSGRMWGMAGVLDPVVLGADLLVALGYVFVLPRGFVSRLVAFLLTIPLTIVLLQVTQHLQVEGAFYRYMY